MAGRIVFAVYDCKGHVTRDSAIYNPRPDNFKPVVQRVGHAPIADSQKI